MRATAEQKRLDQKTKGWLRWGPYLSERQWGTVREDYSLDGNAWNYLSHDQARSYAYRWGEDGIAGYSDDHSRLCFALALWNGRDPILKERLYGLTNSEGNHGEDVKEYYFYLDSTPTHSYMKYLYKYPQAEYPYEQLVRTNRVRTRYEFEYELLDTGVFDDDRYFDIFVEYAKASPEDTLIQITVNNRGSEAATLHLLPTLWFRNTWSQDPKAARPEMHQGPDGRGYSVIAAQHRDLGDCFLCCEGSPTLLFTENETNDERLSGTPNRTPYVKDAFHNYVIPGKQDAVNPQQTGTKAAAYYVLAVPPHDAAVVRLRLTDASLAQGAGTNGGSHRTPFGRDFDDILGRRLAEAHEFYDDVTPDTLDADASNVLRQAFAGMLWSKQHYSFDLDLWLEQHEANPFETVRRHDVRNMQWYHMVNDDVISMPDKWEYPWYAAWDLAFHCIVLANIDVDFAKRQLDLMLEELYLHPSGQIPAYEWNFCDVNPPVRAMAVLYVYSIERELRGTVDIEWLKNVFEGGFLGLDNIGVFDRSSALPTGGYLEQADGTAWMSLFCQNMLEIALELAIHDPTYEPMALKFFEHFLYISAAMDRIGDNEDEMWDEEDGFFYDVLRFPDGTATRPSPFHGWTAAVVCFHGRADGVYPKVPEAHRARPKAF